MSEAAGTGLFAKVIKAGLAVAFIASLIALAWGKKAALGVAAGGAIGVGGLWFWLRFVPWASDSKRPKFWLWAALLAKFIFLWLALYFLIARQIASPAGFCVGIGIVPILLMLLALRPKRDGA